MKPIRYITQTRRMSLWESLVWLVRNRQWIREKIEWVHIPPDDPRYGDAPFEAAFIWAPGMEPKG